MEDRICNVCMVIEDEYMLDVNVKCFPYHENKCIKHFLTTYVNSDVGKMDIESFIDLLASTDSDVLRAVCFIYIYS